MTSLKETSIEEEANEDEYCGEAAARTCFEIALEIAKCSRSYTDGEFVKKCLIIAVKQLCPSKVRVFETLRLSNKSITGYVQTMVGNVMNQIKNVCATFIKYSLAIDQNINLSGTPYVAVFIRGVNINLHVTEELLDLVPLDGFISGQNIFSCIEKIIENNKLDWLKLVSVMTNGPSMIIENQNGIISHLTTKLTTLDSSHKIITMHNLTPAQNLCAKSAVVLNVMSTIVHVVCYIKNHRLKFQAFQTLTQELDSEYSELPNSTEVEWLNRGTVLDKFYNLYEEIINFLKAVGYSVPQLKDTEWLIDFAFLTDLVHHLNVLNLSLQEGKIIVELYDTICAFQMKLQLWIRQLQTGNACHFPRLRLAATGQNCTKKYCAILQILLEEFEMRFYDVQNLDVDLNIFTMPFSVNMDTVPAELQLELINMRCDQTLKQRTGSLIDIYETFSYIRFPHLYNLAAKILSMFGSIYICEQLISNIKKIRTIKPTGITDYNCRCSLILNSCQSVVPNISQLLKERRVKETSFVSHPHNS